MNTKAKIAVHKFSSCDGCQLSLLNLGETLLQLPQLVDIVHFAEAGPMNENEFIDIALVEGSINTQHDQQRIQQIRHHSAYLISLGACATSGGLQALRNNQDAQQWAARIYAKPEYLDTLKTATAITDHVKVDLELKGCPVDSKQVISALRQLLYGVTPVEDSRTLCMECKRQGHVCTLVTASKICMGPVTQAGCGALCPSLGRACYACYGPSESANGLALAERLQKNGLSLEQTINRYRFIHSQTSAFKQTAQHLGGKDDAK